MSESLKKVFDEICQILCRCEQLKGDIIALQGNHAKDYKSLVKSAAFLDRINLYFFQIYIIQLCLLLHSKEDHSLKSFITKLKEERKKISDNPESIKKINEALVRVERLESSNLYPLRTLRDKFWAHRDKNRNAHKISITYSNAWDILLELQSIFNLLNSAIFDTSTHFKILSEREPIELAHLDYFTKMRERLKPERMNPSSEIVNDLLYLMRGKDVTVHS